MFPVLLTFVLRGVGEGSSILHLSLPLLPQQVAVLP